MTTHRRSLLYAIVSGMLLLWGAGDAAAATVCHPTADAGVERCVTGLAASALPGMMQTQKQGRWCWAAGISMVLARYGVRVAQEEIVTTLFGRTEDEGASAKAIAQLLDRRWQGDDGAWAEASALPVARWWRQMGLMAPVVLDELDHERPLILGTQEHVVVLVELMYERSTRRNDLSTRLLRAVVLDPAPPIGVRSLRLEETNPDFVTAVQVRKVGGPQLASLASSAAPAREAP